MVSLRDWLGDASVPVPDVPLACSAREKQVTTSLVDS